MIRIYKLTDETVEGILSGLNDAEDIAKDCSTRPGDKADKEAARYNRLACILLYQQQKNVLIDGVEEKEGE